MAELQEQIDTLAAPQGTVELGRLAAGRAPVRAWDAADVLALEYLAEEQLIEATASAGRQVAIVNDSFGALATVLAGASPLVIGDVITSQSALAANLLRNGLAADAARFVPTGGDLADMVHADLPLGLVVVKVPKTTALLEAQLMSLVPHLDQHTVVVGASMAKHLHRSALDTFERLLGPTSTSLAKRKARLVHPALDAAVLAKAPAALRPNTFVHDGLTIAEHAGVFSAGRIDEGTSLLLDALGSEGMLAGDETIVDLGCGNGVIGTAAGRLAPDADVTMTDVSWSAVMSARETWAAAHGERPVQVVAVDSLPASVIADGAVDVVISNPPFHTDHAVGDATSWRMFNDVYRALKPGGSFIVVGNRHLAYHAKLHRIFGNSSVLASNPKFVVLRATR